MSRQPVRRRVVRRPHRAVIVVALIVAAAISAASIPGSVARATPTTSATLDTPFGVVGQWVVDAHGRVVIMHGENVVDKRPPYTPAHYGFDDSDARFLAGNGFNAIRLGITWEAAEPRPGVINENYLREIRDFVARMASHGIVTMVEFHQDRWSAGLSGEGAPAWATFTDGFPNLAQSLLLSQVSPAIFSAFANFFANRKASDGVGIQDHFLRVWQRTSEILSGTPGLMGYGILNEPAQGWPVDVCVPESPCGPDAAQRLRSFYDKAEDIIRGNDASTPIIESPYVISAAGLDSGMTASTRSNIAFGFNSYAVPCILGLRVPLPACRPFYETTHSDARKHLREFGQPVMMTEFGATDMADTLEYQTNEADAERLSWFHWNYGGNDPSTTAPSPSVEGLVHDARIPPTGTNVNVSNLKALARPYPELVAGTPVKWNFDPHTRKFTFTFTPARVGGGTFAAGEQTWVSVPPVQYPNGFRVDVRGGSAQHRSATGVAVVADGSQPVDVTITPS